MIFLFLKTLKNKNPGKLRTFVSLYDPFPNSIRRFAPHVALARAHEFPNRRKLPDYINFQANSIFGVLDF